MEELTLAGSKKPTILGDLSGLSKVDLVNITNEMNNRVQNNLAFNVPLEIKAIIIDKKELQSKFNNEVVNCPVISFITSDNKVYITFSNGIAYSLRNIVSIWGVPPYKDFKMVFTEEKMANGKLINNINLVVKS